MKKVNKKGFTMVELLATIAILGVLSTVAVGAVMVHLENSRQQAMETIASTAYDGMVNYMMENNVMLNPKGQANSSTSISIDTLYQEDYIERPTDPYNNGVMCEGSVSVTNETTSATVGLDDYRYTIQVNCSGGHSVTKQYP